MVNMTAISMAELEQESAELLTARETLCVAKLLWHPHHHGWGWGGWGDGGWGWGGDGGWGGGWGGDGGWGGGWGGDGG